MVISWCTAGGEDIDLHARVAAALQAWTDVAPCAAFEVDDLGDCATAESPTLSFVPDDPDDAIEDGVLAVSYSGGAYVGEVIVINDAPFSSDAEVAAGACADTFNLDLLLRHLVGVHLGLGYTCEAGEPCTDAEEWGAVMNWTLDTCDARQPNAADAALVRARYGPVLLPAADAAPVVSVGAVPLDVCVSLEAASADAADAATVTWDFGDGSFTEGLDACHTYEAEGAYTIGVDVAYTPECGGGVGTATYGTVTTCDVPHADGPLFDWSVSGMTLSLAGNIVSLPACVDGYHWVIADSAADVVAEMETSSLTVELPAAGTYTVTLAVTGMAGIAEESREITVEDPAKEEEGCAGCAAPAGAGPAWSVALVVAAVARRRPARS